MILQDIKELKTGREQLRKFGLLVGGVLAVMGLLWIVRGRHAWVYALSPGALLLLLGVVAPRVLKPIYIAWMTLAILLGFVVSHLILTLFFFLVITPVGLVARAAGKDFLHLKIHRDQPSYWVPRNRQYPRQPAEYERQF